MSVSCFRCSRSRWQNRTREPPNGFGWNFHWRFSICPDTMFALANPFRLLPVSQGQKLYFFVHNFEVITGFNDNYWTYCTETFTEGSLDGFRRRWKCMSMYDTPIRRYPDLLILSDPLTIFKIFSASFEQTVSNIARFSDPPNRPSNLDRIDRQSDLLTIFKIFSARCNWMRCWPSNNTFEHCTISGSSESAVESLSNWRPDKFTGRGFNFSAFYALALLVVEHVTAT